MNVNRIKGTRRWAWFVLCFLVCTATYFSYLLSDFYSTKESLRAERLSDHYKQVREIQCLQPTPENLASVATNYLHLGVGALAMIDRAESGIIRLVLTLIALCAFGCLVPIRVLRNFKPPL